MGIWDNFDSGKRDAVYRRKVEWIDDDGRTHSETKTEILPSKKGAAAGAAAGAAVAGPVGAVVGGLIGGIFGPED